MKMKSWIQSLSIVSVSLLLASAAFAVDIGQIEKDLAGPGVLGWVHGAVESRSLYVFTYRNPDNFFDSIQMSLVSDDPAITKSLSVLGRHDQVRVKGSFMDNPSPQKHILVTSVELVKKYDNPYPEPDYEHEAKIPDELTTIDHATFLVHAVAGDGQILVTEYKDQIVPIYVKNAALTKDLYRGDIVSLHFRLRKTPDQPSHLALIETAPDALVRLQAIKDFNGKKAVVEGALILFPKSPEIVFNVFAVEDTSYPGIKRQFTLLNQDDPTVFAAIRAKLQAAWDRHPGAYINDRNKLKSTAVRVKVTGVYQEIDPGQANAQVLLNSAADIEIIE